MVWLVKDGCGICCVILAWLLMAFSQYAFLTVVLIPQVDPMKRYLNIIFFEFFSVLALVAHLRTIFTDPGSIPKQTATPELMQEISLTSPPNLVVYKCSECCSLKPDKTHHCSVCGRCIRKMDHHCPWVNNCVGERNQNCLDADLSTNNPCSIMTKGGKPSPERLIMLVFLSFEALLFSMFTVIMFSIQIKAIWSERRRKEVSLS